MKTNQIIKKIIAGTASDSDINELAMAVAQQSERGQWYDGPGSTNVLEWIINGSFTGNETIETLVTEWDEE
jgi:hypothetical protein